MTNPIVAFRNSEKGSKNYKIIYAGRNTTYCPVLSRIPHPANQPTITGVIYCSNKGTAVAQWLRCCATNRKVAGSIPAGVIGTFH